MTPAVDAAKRAGIAYTLHTYEGVDSYAGDYALAVAAALRVEPARLFKTNAYVPHQNDDATTM